VPLNQAQCAELAGAMTALSVSAAQAILQWQGKGGVRNKSDGSPVTGADEAAEEVIHHGLERLNLGIPIISEEQAGRERRCLEGADFIFVDPLDGTREFIAGRDEYTVNIGLVRGGIPILGVVTAPALGLIWRGTVGCGAERLSFSAESISAPQPIHTRPRPQHEAVVVTSRSHLDAHTQAYMEGIAGAQRLACGSSVKFCRLAEGAADLYPRLSPTHDWDVAAGHAVLLAAGGSMVAPDGSAPVYGTPDLIIPAFLAFGDPQMSERLDRIPFRSNRNAV
jgi:3'(2'), 5'-bisphosphate nucleotidase